MHFRRLPHFMALVLVMAVLNPSAVAPGVSAQTGASSTPSSVTFQVNAAHTGNLADPALKPPLKQLWAVDFGEGQVSYPVVVEDKVYVTAAHDQSMGPYGSRLYALNAATGALAWGPVELGGSYWWSALAYDAGKLFALADTGLLRAYNSNDGTPIWSLQLPEAYEFSAPPTALNGIIYVSDSGPGGLFAINEANGAILWRGGEAGPHDGPAVTDSAVYIGGSCANVRALVPGTGAEIWNKDSGCSGQFGATAVYYNGKVYVRSIEPPNLLVVDAKTGQNIQTYSADRMPVFDGSRAFLSADGNLQGVDEATGRILWTFAGEGDVSSDPIVVNGTVYVGSLDSRLYGLNPATGSLVFTASLPAPFERPDDWNGTRTIGMGAGNGRLFVPVSSLLVAFASDPNATTAPGCQLFKETGKTLCSGFLDYWRTHGGLAQQGFPISTEMQETSDTDGKVYTEQYFERAVFEYHPENKAPNDVLLSLLGVFRYKDKYQANAPGQAVNTAPNTVVFRETGKSLGGRFLQYWQAHGGLVQQGLPLSNEFLEKSDLDGKNYLVQYFERAVFEYHPENTAPNDVLLSQLGTFRYHSRYERPGALPGTLTSTPAP